MSKDLYLLQCKAYSLCNLPPKGGSSARKITSWFERFIWLGPTGLISTSSKPKSFERSRSPFSPLTTIGEDPESLQEWIQQRVRNHPATKDQPQLQALMLQPVPKLTQAFAESMIQVAQKRGRSLVLVLDTYEKAQPYLNQWLWQHLVEDTTLYSAPVRLVVVGRRSLDSCKTVNVNRQLILQRLVNQFYSPSQIANVHSNIIMAIGENATQTLKIFSNIWR